MPARRIGIVTLRTQASQLPISKRIETVIWMRVLLLGLMGFKTSRATTALALRMMRRWTKMVQDLWASEFKQTLALPTLEELLAISFRVKIWMKVWTQTIRRWRLNPRKEYLETEIWTITTWRTTIKRVKGIGRMKLLLLTQWTYQITTWYPRMSLRVCPLRPWAWRLPQTWQVMMHQTCT